MSAMSLLRAPPSPFSACDGKWADRASSESGRGSCVEFGETEGRESQLDSGAAGTTERLHSGGCLRWLVPAQRLCALEETTGAPALELGEVGVVELLRQTPLKADEAELGGVPGISSAEPLLDRRDWHPAWNKLAHARRVLILGTYEAVVCLDDDILIRDPVPDPLGEAIETYLVPNKGAEKLIVASLDDRLVDARVPFNSGVLILKSSPRTLMILDEVFKLGRRLKLVNGYTWLPRITGLWDQESSPGRLRRIFAALGRPELCPTPTWPAAILCSRQLA
eukprot:g17032.t1